MVQDGRGWQWKLTEDGGIGEPDDGDEQDEGGGSADSSGEENSPRKGRTATPQAGRGDQGADDGRRRQWRTSRWGWRGARTRRPRRRGGSEGAARAAKQGNSRTAHGGFREQWEPAVDKLDKAAKAFEGLDLDDLAEGPEDSTSLKASGSRRDGGSSSATQETRGTS